MPLFLTGCEGGGADGRGDGDGAVVGGFLKLSNSCPKPAAKAVLATNNIKIKQICLISLTPTLFYSNCSCHPTRLPNDTQLEQDRQAVPEAWFVVEYKLDFVE